MEVEHEEDIEQFDDEEELNEFCIEDNPNEINKSTSPDFTQEISTLVSAIGIIDDSTNKHFIRGEYCHSAIARLEYLLRQEYIKNRRTKDYDDDTDNNEIFNKCGEFMVMTKKLIPCFKQCMQDIIKHGSHTNKSQKLQNTVKLLIKMFTRFTFPLTYNINNTVDNYVNYNKYRYFLEYQQTFKKSLIDNTVLFQIIMLMDDCHIDLDPDERSESDVDLLELYLCLLRNILAIPNRIESDDFLHDRAILAFKDEKLMDVLIELSTNIGEESDKIQYLLMDIFFQFFRLEDAESMIVKKKININNNQLNMNNESNMYKQYKQEKLNRKSSMKRRRHKNFGGLSRIKMMNGQTRVQSMGNDSMGNETMYDRRKAKRFRPVKEKQKRIYLNDTIKKSLDYVADLLLKRSFTPLINTMHHLLGKKMEHELNESQDCKKWIKLMSLFLKYHRLKTRTVAAEKAKEDGVNFNNLKWYSSSNISCVLKEDLVNFIISRAQTLFENRKNKYWQCESHFKRLEELLLCYKEIIRSIYSMIKYGNNVNIANGIKLFTYIFEDGRGPELIHDMINEYKVHQTTKLCLTYCIEAVYYTITICEIMQNNGNDLSVKTKRKQKRKKKKKKKKPNNNNNNNNNMDIEGMEDEEKHIVEVAGMEIHDMSDDDDDDDDEDEMMFYRKDFEFEEFMRKYASNKVVTQYMYIFEDYATNSAKLNSYIINMFNRLAFKLKYAPLLFQLKYFLLFDKILNDQIIMKDKNYNIVRKFCLNIMSTFFKHSKKNKVLFIEILFHKTMYAISDINTPGTANQQIQSRKQKTNKRRDRVDIDGFDDAMDEDFDSEEEYEELNINMTEWTEKEDELLRNYYSTYAIQSNVFNILSELLENELNITRSNAQIEHRLNTLGLRKKKKKRNNRNNNNNNNNESKKRIKPKEMNMEQRKSIIYKCIHKASYVNNNNDENINKTIFKWLYGKLDVLCDIIADDMSAASDMLMDDIAIVPIQLNEFDYMNNVYVVDLLVKLGFLAPSKYIGTIWWRIPREFKLSEIQKMVQLMEEAVELPENADLNDLCVVNESEMDIALMNDNNNDNINSNPFELGLIEENNNEEINNGYNDKKEQSESDEEYQITDISEMKNNNNNSIENEDDIDIDIEREKKKKKKKKKKHKKHKKSKKKSKRDKKKKKHKKKHRDNDDENNESKKKKKKHKRKSRKRKRDKMIDNEINEDENNNNNIKRRRLIVNRNNTNDDNDEEDGFLNDIVSDMDEDNENENENINIDIEMNNNMNMNTPQINKFQSLTLTENDNMLNVINENDNESEDEIVIKRKITKRSFVSDSDSD